jgi:transposase
VPLRSKVELYAAIRRDSRAGMSGRALEHKYGVGRRTVAKALASAWPEPRKPLPPRATRLDAYLPVIDQMLRVDLDAPRKQRHTVKRIFDRLVAEHGAVGVSYGMVRGYVARRRPEIRIEAGRGPPDAFIPQSHLPGVEAEVDFGDVAVRLRGEQVTCALFSFRLSYSGKAVHRIFASGGQEAFFEGHVHALDVLGGVPTRAPSKCGLVWLVMVGSVGRVDVEQARLPAIMWVSKPMTRPDRRACLLIIPHCCGCPAAGRARRAGPRPVPQPARPPRPDHRPPPPARPTASTGRRARRRGLRGPGRRQVPGRHRRVGR